MTRNEIQKRTNQYHIERKVSTLRKSRMKRKMTIMLASSKFLPSFLTGVKDKFKKKKPTLISGALGGSSYASTVRYQSQFIDDAFSTRKKNKLEMIVCFIV